MPEKKKMTKSDASRIQSTQAKAGRDMSKGGFSARAQSAGDRHGNANANATANANANANANAGDQAGVAAGNQSGRQSGADGGWSCTVQ